MHTIYDTLFDNPAIDNARECLLFQGRRFTFAELRSRTAALARGLSAQGVSRGDRVAVLLHNCNEFVEAFYAVTALGALFVPLNWRLHPAEHLALMQDCAPVAIISEAHFEPSCRAALAAIPSLRLHLEVGAQFEAFLLSGGEGELVRRVDGDDDAAILYTSGTTSLPKGVVLTHRNYVCDHTNVGEFAGIDSASVNLQNSPLYHAAGMHTFMHVTYGARTVLTPRFDVSEALSLIARERVSYMFAVPTVIYALLDSPELANADLSALRTISYGAAPMSETRFREAVEAFGFIFIHAYGMTESSSHSSLLGKDEHRSRAGSVGRGLATSRVRIVREDGTAVAPGEIGEIVIAGPQVMSRYWNRPDATAQTLRDGWLYSGDLGVADGDGFIYVKDRKHDMIISGGVNIFPREIEEVIASHPAVAEVAVYGLPDEKWGEAVAASVVLRDGSNVDADEIRRFVGGSLARYKIPRTLDFPPHLPKNPSGKVLKRVLRDSQKAHRA